MGSEGLMVKYNTGSKGDLTLGLPAKDMWTVVYPLANLVNLSGESKRLRDVPKGTETYDGRQYGVPLKVEMRRDGDDFSTKFTPIGEEGNQLLLQIAQVLGVSPEPLESAARH